MKSNNKTAFWEHNLNPITMFYERKSQTNMLSFKTGQKGHFIKANELHKYIAANSLMAEFNIGSVKLKSTLRTIDEHPKYHGGHTYYRNNNIESIKDVLSEKKGVFIDKTKYISNPELMKMFGFTAFKAWEIAKNQKLKKYKFSRNVIYYEREKAIELFSKNKKQS